MTPNASYGIMWKGESEIHTLSRLSNYIDPVKSEIVMNSFISLYFSYYPLVWMFCDRATTAKLNRTFEKALLLVCKCSELKLEYRISSKERPERSFANSVLWGHSYHFVYIQTAFPNSCEYTHRRNT